MQFPQNYHQNVCFLLSECVRVQSWCIFLKTPPKYILLVSVSQSPILIQYPQNPHHMYASTSLHVSKSNLDAIPSKFPPSILYYTHSPILMRFPQKSHQIYTSTILRVQSWCIFLKTPTKLYAPAILKLLGLGRPRIIMLWKRKKNMCSLLCKIRTSVE